ncbi:MAG TPA: glycosyltransferase [Candidatus Dormibacteraeota bacterium]|nr:glycosyltransferase [Candidatus Dormibacteraeota bacterium]
MTAERLLVAVTAFAVHPPRRGGQARPAGLLANLGPGWRVEHYAQSFQRTDLPWPAERRDVTPRWTEHNLRDPVSTAWHALAGRLGYPPVGADRLLGLLPRRAVRSALRRADAVYTSHPYQVPWVRAATPDATPVVLDSPNVETEVYTAAGSGMERRLTAAVGRAERRAWSLVDLALTSTVEDATVLLAGGVPRVAVVPNGADVEAVHPATGAERAAARRELGLPGDGILAVFVGSAHPPNVEAVRLLEDAAPSLRGAGVVVAVVGRAGTGRNPVPGVVHAGEVPAVAPWLAAADIALCPLLSGGGSSLKVAEYLAAGLPLVTTPVGARGFDLTDGWDALVREPADLPSAVADLAGDPAGRRLLGAAARAHAEERLGWASAGRAMAAAIGELLERPGAGDQTAAAASSAPRTDSAQDRHV